MGTLKAASAFIFLIPKAPKDKSWKSFLKLPMDLAVLEFNYKGAIYQMLNQELGLDIDTENLSQLKKWPISVKIKDMKLLKSK